MAHKLLPGQRLPDGRVVRGWGVGIITKDKVKVGIVMIYIADDEERNVEEVEVRFRNYPDELKDMASKKFRELFWLMWREYGLIAIKDPDRYRAKLSEISKIRGRYMGELFPENIFPRARLTNKELVGLFMREKPFY